MKPAYPNAIEPVTITLYCNIPFDNTYKHHTMISSLFTYDGTQIYTSSNAFPWERFINRRKYSETPVPVPTPPMPDPLAYYPHWTSTDTYNFNFSNGLLGSVVMSFTNANMTNSNYMKVKAGSYYYYYFITSINQINVDTYTLSLELDVLMTYQDEFLQGMKDVPVFTNRKHCHRYTSNGLVPYCADFKTGDDTYAGVKPSIIKNKYQLNYSSSAMKNLKGIMWLYICCDYLKGDDDPVLETLYVCNHKTYPLSMMAIPLNVDELIYSNPEGTKMVTYNKTMLQHAIASLINDGSVHGAKVSPYPPFTRDAEVLYNSSTKTLSIISSVTDVITSSVLNIYEMHCSSNKFWYGSETLASSNTFIDLLCSGCILVKEQLNQVYSYDIHTPSTLGFVNNSAPSILSNRYQDPKLLFAPFKKYVLGTQYSTTSYEFFPELVFCDKACTSSGSYFQFSTFATAYIGDNNFYTYVYSSNGSYNNYQYERIGLASSVNYVFPCGTNALDVFNATQAQAFYQSKTASGITSGLTIAGGIASTAIGAGLIASGGGSPVGIGLVATGAMGIASGIAGEVNNAKSITAKKEDLKNTPDSINVSGSNFIIDDTITEGTTGGLPYILVYETTNVIKENANDFFYTYGYQVARECYFNTELKVNLTANGFVDNNLFGRTIFNYIQINEDITNKINAEIPLIVKQKLSNIFNNGITIWNFFGIDSIWGNGSVSETYNPDNWFMKCNLDNTEYSE